MLNRLSTGKPQDRMKTLLTAIILFFFLFFFSCKENPPEIQQLFWQLTIVEDKDIDIVYESLSIFVHPMDEDGIEDVESVYIINDSAELFWKLNNDNWERKESEGYSWLGSNRIVMADYSAFPRGTYRVIVIDAGGNRDEGEIYLGADKLTQSQIDFPTLLVEENKFTIDSVYSKHTLWLYDSVGTGILTHSTGDKEIARDKLFPDLRQAESASYAYVYAYDERRGVGIASGPYRF